MGFVDIGFLFEFCISFCVILKSSIKWSLFMGLIVLNNVDFMFLVFSLCVMLLSFLFVMLFLVSNVYILW